MQVNELQGFTDKEVEEFREAFNMFDMDHDGRITGAELQTVMRKLRQRTTPEEIRDMIRNVDVDGNGTIEFEEFLEMMTSRLNSQLAASEEVRRQSEDAEARQAFAVFDRDGDGLIDLNELRQTMRDLGEELSDADLQAMMIAADTNRDGKVDFQEFLIVMRRKGQSLPV